MPGRGTIQGTRGLTGRPLKPPAAEHVRVDVRHVLAGVRATVEDHAIARLADALRYRGGVGHGRHLLEQAAAGGDHRRDVGVVLLWYDQDMNRGLWINIAERDGP